VVGSGRRVGLRRSGNLTASIDTDDEFPIATFWSKFVESMEECIEGAVTLHDHMIIRRSLAQTALNEDVRRFYVSITQSEREVAIRQIRTGESELQMRKIRRSVRKFLE